MTSPAFTEAVSPLSNNSVAVPCSTTQVCCDAGCAWCGVVAPGCIVTLVIVMRASGAVLGQISCCESTPGFSRES